MSELARTVTMDNSRHTAGFTLIEIAVVMLIIGIIMAFGGKAYQLYKIEKENMQTENALIRAGIHIAAFKERYGRYPCPARYDVDRTNPAYGSEGDCTDTTTAAGDCAAGYCVENSIRTVTRDDGSTFVPRVRRGSIPFRDLNLMEEDSYDAFGGRFSYAVTENLTASNTFDLGEGGIEVVDGATPTPQSLVQPAGSGLYFLFSHGRDRVGSYNKQGVEVIACNGPMYDAENCDTEFDPDAVYRLAENSEDEVVIGGSVIPGPPPPPPPTGTVNTHYDDFATFKGGDQNPVWKYSESSADPDNAHDLGDPADEILIGPAVALDDERLVVSSNLAGEGILRSDTSIQGNLICNEAGTDCFPSRLIAGNDPAMQCPSGEYIRQIVDGRVECIPLQPITCDPNEYVIGFTNGSPICEPFISSIFCDPINVTVCPGEDRVVPRLSVGSLYTVTAGASRAGEYECLRNGNTATATWTATGPFTGVCTCTPSSETVDDGAGSCGTGYTGNTSTTTTTVCPSGQTTYDIDRAGCICQPGTETRNEICPANYSGSITESREITCVGNTAVYGPWTSSGACICDAQAPETRLQACPENHTGSITETRNWDTDTCSWGEWAQTNTACVCEINNENRTTACAAPLDGTMEQTRVSQCPSGAWGDWTTVSSNCTCGTTQETRPGPACPSGQSGTITEARNVDCYGNGLTPWTTISNTCRSCSWQTGEPVTGSGGINVTSACTCGERTGMCRERINGVWYSYLNCECSD